MFKRAVGGWGLITVMDATPENLLTTKKAFWKRRESNLSGIVLVVGQPFPLFRGALVLAAPKPVRDHLLTMSVVKEKNWRMLLGSQLQCLRKWVFMQRPAQVSGNLFLVYIYMISLF